MLKVEVYRGSEGLQAISHDWQRLFERLEHRRFFHHYGWWKSYLEALVSDPGSVSFFLVRCGPQPLAIIPLKRAVRRMFGLRTNQWQLPQHEHMPLGDILCARKAIMPEVFAALLRALRAQKNCPWVAVMMDRVLEESPLWQMVTGAHGRVHASILKTCDHIPCQGSYADITAAFSRNFRSNLNKARNKLARETGVEFASVTVPADLPRCFADFMELEAAGWRGIRGSNTAIKLRPELAKFYLSLIDELGREGAVAINCLRVNGRLIAGQFCVRDDDTLYILKLAYDEAWSHVAPGNMLLERTIQDGISRRGFNKIDLVGNPPWFRDWRPSSQYIHTVWLFNSTALGWVLWTILKIKQMLRPFYRKYLRGHASGRQRQTPDKIRVSGSILAGASQRDATAVRDRLDARPN